VVKAASNSGIEVVGLEDSFDGLIEPDRSRVLTPRDVTGILRLGGTILGTTNRGNPFAYPVATSEGIHDYSNRVVEMFHKMGLDALVVIGGDGTLAIAHQFCNGACRWSASRRRSTTISTSGSSRSGCAPAIGGARSSASLSWRKARAR